MSKDVFSKAKFLYYAAVSHETPMDSPDDVSLSIRNMLADIQELGYKEFRCFADVELRKIKDPRIMKVLLKYCMEMDLFTKDTLMYKINPKHCPEIISIAKKEFLKLSPSDKLFLNGFQIAMSRATITDAYLDEMVELMKIGEHYAYLSEVRKKICKTASERMIPLIEKYSQGVLVLCAIQDCRYLEPSENIIEKLEKWSNITDDEIKCLQLTENNQGLSVTTYEYYRNLCSVKRIRAEARLALKKLRVQC